MLYVQAGAVLMNSGRQKTSKEVEESQSAQGCAAVVQALHADGDAAVRHMQSCHCVAGCQAPLTQRELEKTLMYHDQIKDKRMSLVRLCRFIYSFLLFSSQI